MQESVPCACLTAALPTESVSFFLLCERTHTPKLTSARAHRVNIVRIRMFCEELGSVVAGGASWHASSQADAVVDERRFFFLPSFFFCGRSAASMRVR